MGGSGSGRAQVSQGDPTTICGRAGPGTGLASEVDQPTASFVERWRAVQRIGVRHVMRSPIEGDALSEVSPSLAWLRDVLWGEGGSTRVELDPRAGEQRPTREWMVLPSAASPTLLVPTRGRVAAKALLQFNDSMTQGARLAKAGVGVAIQGRLARFFFRDRLSIFTGDSDSGRDLIESELPKLLGVPRVEVAISIGRSLRPNIKPVIRIMAPDGRVLAFAKLAWNSLTSSLVENEVMTLAKLEGRVIRSFRVPRVLHHGEWNGYPLALFSPLSHGLLRRWPVNALPPSTVLREVAGLEGQSRGPLIGGPYWREVSERARAAACYMEDGARLEAAISKLEARVSTIEVIHCMSHGDFAPWNMMHAPRAINVWDWERASETRPLGADILHFTFEVAYHKEGRDPLAAIDVALERSRDVLGDLGVSRLTGEAIRDVYVLDRLTRLLEGRRAGVSVDDRLLGSLAHSLIGRDR